MTDGYGERQDRDPSFRPRARNVEPYVQQERIRTIHFGIGAIGSEVVRTMLNSPEIEIVGAIDSNPAKAGKDLGEAAGLGRKLGIPISYEVEPLLKEVYADIVVHSTSSSLTEVCPQLLSVIGAEKSVVSSCEELAFPWIRYPDISQRLDRKAREGGVRVLGTGVNPGFVMDLLPLMLTTICQQLKSVRVERIVDVSTRRMQLQRKVGVGLSVTAFQEAVDSGALGHIGLRESLYMLADTIGWRLEDVSETIEPVLAKEKRKTPYFSVDRGYLLGLRQTLAGIIGGREVIRLALEMSLGVSEPRDTIEIDAVPPLKVVIPGGVQGDIATASIMANCVPAVARSRMVGLISMRDLPLLAHHRPRPMPREDLV